MSLQTFHEHKFLFNTNMRSSSSEAGMSGYRGALVLVEGEKDDKKRHSMPPLEVMRGVVLPEKSDLKQLSTVNKILTIYKEYNSYKPGCVQLALEGTLANTSDIKREAWGAV